MSQNISLVRGTEVQKLQKQHKTLLKAQGLGTDTRPAVFLLGAGLSYSCL